MTPWSGACKSRCGGICYCGGRAAVDLGEKIQQQLVESVRLVDRRSMPRIGDDLQPGVAQVADVLTLVLDRGVVTVGADHQHRAVDTLQPVAHTPADDGAQ